jgi:hypothetical protein
MPPILHTHRYWPWFIQKVVLLQVIFRNVATSSKKAWTFAKFHHSYYSFPTFRIIKILQLWKEIRPCCWNYIFSFKTRRLKGGKQIWLWKDDFGCKRFCALHLIRTIMFQYVKNNYVFPKDIKMHIVDHIIPPKWVTRIVNKNCKC